MTTHRKLTRADFDHAQRIIDRTERALGPLPIGQHIELLAEYTDWPLAVCGHVANRLDELN